MSTTLTTTASPSSAVTKISTKTARSKIIKLRLSPKALARFPSDQPTQKASRSKSSSNSSPPSKQVIEPSPADATPESNATPIPNGSNTDSNSLAPPPNTTKRRGIPGPKPGSKRSAPLMADGMPKPRGKPGPKKKPRFGELTNGDPASKSPLAGVAPISTQKLGPKANQGAINAGLRALDRTGKPCRKWERKGFQLKSFTGVTWSVPSWRAPKKTGVDIHGDVKSDTTGSSDSKLNEISAVASEQSNSGADNDTPMLLTNIASSPIAGS